NGVGTRRRSGSSPAMRSLDMVYKLQEYAGRPRRKRSEGKATWPGRRQVFRRVGGDGRAAGDVVTVAGDPQSGRALLRPVLRDGRRIGELAGAAEARAYA